MAEFLLLPFVEIEIRLGTFGKSFDSCIDKKYFDQICSFLQTGDWISMLETQSNETIDNNLKLINNKSLMMKENVLTKTIQLPNSPFDIRLSINQEISLDSYKSSFLFENNIIRKKTRKTFLSFNFKYDLTIVKETINNITKEKYELEIELLVNEDTLTWTSNYINDFLECKIFDIINIVEKIKREDFKLKLF